MGRSDWTLLTTSVSPLASSDMYVAIGHVQEYSVGHNTQLSNSSKITEEKKKSMRVSFSNATRAPRLKKISKSAIRLKKCQANFWANRIRIQQRFVAEPFF
jgi:hypothetical protein